MRARLWGRVIFPNDNLSFIFSLTALLQPYEPPITKVIVLFSCASLFKYEDNSSLDNSLPLISKSMGLPESLSSISSPSSETILFISWYLFCSATSTMESLQNLPSRFSYSLDASVQKRSFKLPTQTSLIFIIIHQTQKS